MLLLLFAFLSGIITILAPCIWPILPIVLSTSAIGGKWRPVGVVLGIVLSFSAFTLVASFLVSIFHLDPNLLRGLAVLVLIFLGLAFIFPVLLERLEVLASKLLSRVPMGNTSRQGFGGGFVTGLALGVVWSPCAGPILAAIASLAISQSISIQLVLVTLSYAAGVGVPLLILALVGNRLLSRTRIISAQTGNIQKIFGAITILTALAIYFGFDRNLQVALLDRIPAYSNVLYSLENNQLAKEQLDKLLGRKPMPVEDMGKKNVSDLRNDMLPNLGPAPEFVGVSKWLNLESSSLSLRLSDLRGKVVLVDFWTYTCINCIRTLPHVTSWYDKYRDAGFVVIGVHTPEFEFEKDSNNVLNAIKQYNIHYPVAQDNDYATWNNYDNRYWPAKYLIDARGNVRYVHFGEGEYETTEKNIQKLLGEIGGQIGQTLTELPDTTPRMRLTPETYLGSARMSGLAKLSGDWKIEDEFAQAGNNSSLEMNFYADKVFLVLTPGKSGDKVKVYLDGELVEENDSGADVKNGEVLVEKDWTYNLIDLRDGPGNHILRLEFVNPGIKAFAFTFG